MSWISILSLMYDLLVRLKLSCTIRLPLKVKLMAKYFLKNMPKQAFITIFQFSDTLVEA